MKEKIALIDADSLIYFEMGKPTLEEAISGIDERIKHILNQCNTTKYIGFLTIGRCFRYNIATIKDYKYNRKGGKPKPPIFYALKEYIKQKWNFLYVKELEADDLVALYQKYYGKENTVICSPDKDVLKQLEGTHYNYGKAEHIVTTRNDAQNFLLTQMLMGDPTDGIPGMPKVGPKTAEKWVTEEPTVDMVLKKYMEKFGIHEGIHRFAETFNLVYLLRTQDELLAITGITHTFSEVFNLENTIDEDEDWS